MHEKRRSESAPLLIVQLRTQRRERNTANERCGSSSIPCRDEQSTSILASHEHIGYCVIAMPQRLLLKRN